MTLRISMPDRLLSKHLLPEYAIFAPRWLWRILLGFGVLIGLCTVTNIDLTLSSWFYEPDVGWRYAEAWGWRSLFEFGLRPAIFMAITAFVVLIGSWLRPAWVPYRRACLVLVLAVALGPGLVVNSILKPYWGRPRPRHVTEFGGMRAFHHWWQPGGLGSGKSFPSGHAAMGFVMVAGAVLIPQRYRRLRHTAIGVALGYGLLLGCGRIVQGGHFFSDVLWAGILVVLITYVLWRTLARPLPGR
jgi:membrane-associated PAP2 superfamily phosphatase